jgi:hypothetical protein
MPAFIIFKDILYVSTNDQADEMPLHHGMHPRVNKRHTNGGLSMASHEVMKDHGRKMTSQSHWR